jgi:glycosyltransferase involved in cell wall biosynthesis
MSSKHSLAIIGGRAAPSGTQFLTHVSFGKIVHAFAQKYERIFLSCPVKKAPSHDDDYLLPDNATIIPQPEWTTTIDSFRYLPSIKKSYKQVIRAADHVFIRGNPVAATAFLYKCCAEYNRPVCHWLVGNPMALLQSHKRDNLIKDFLGRLYIAMWERELLKGRKRADGSFLCNGQELADRYPTPKTKAIVSTTLSENDFFIRDDTCKNEKIVLLCLCYIRPEKGIEYLIEALQYLDTKYCDFQLLIAGSRERYPQYQDKLDKLIDRLGFSERITWTGHLSYTEIPEIMARSDIFVFPSLSEGTPRVLVEARANGLPIVSTNVGGIPTSVQNGIDGILVPPKAPKAMADAIMKIAKDSNLRQQMIHAGYKSAREMTLDKFVDGAIQCFADD